MANRKNEAWIMVPTVLIKVLIPKELKDSFRNAFLARPDERFAYAGFDSTDNGIVGCLIELRPNDRTDGHEHIRGVCDSIGLTLHLEDPLQ